MKLVLEGINRGTGIQLRNTGFPRIKYGAGLVKPGMTIKLKGFLTQFLRFHFYKGGSTLILPVAVVKVILLVLPFVLVNVRPPVEAVELGLNWKLFPGGKSEN